MKKFNDEVEIKEAEWERPLHSATIEQSSNGFYKISFDDVKWYEGYRDVDNFMSALQMLTDKDIPWVFIRIGEDRDDIEYKDNWVDDMPDELSEFEPDISVYDPESDYKTIDLEEVE